MSRTEQNTSPQSLASIASFHARAKYFQLRRMLRDWRRPCPVLAIGDPKDFPFLLAESVTAIFTNSDPRASIVDWQEGKPSTGV
jgi:hypothetical protein